METKVSIVNMAKEVAKEEVKVLTLSDKQRELLYNVIKSFNKADSSNKEFFCVLLALYKQGFEKGAIMLEIGRILNKAKQGDELLARLRKMNELARPPAVRSCCASKTPTGPATWPIRNSRSSTPWLGSACPGTRARTSAGRMRRTGSRSGSTRIVRSSTS